MASFSLRSKYFFFFLNGAIEFIFILGFQKLGNCVPGNSVVNVQTRLTHRAFAHRTLAYWKMTSEQEISLVSCKKAENEKLNFIMYLLG